MCALNRAISTTACLLLACIVVLAQLVAVGHSLSTRHTICDEHGEVVHAQDVEVSSRLADPLGAALLTGLPAASHEHGCSLLMGLSHSAAAPPHAGWAVLQDLPQAAVHALPTLPALPSRSCLRFAPKTSPPGCLTTA